jgi:hypothetical protein
MTKDNASSPSSVVPCSASATRERTNSSRLKTRDKLWSISVSPACFTDDLMSRRSGSAQQARA